MTNSTNTDEYVITSAKKEYSVDGFSLRFSAFLDAIEFPANGRYTYGASLCSVSVNTFKSWCDDDIVPKTLGGTEKMLELLMDYKGKAEFPVKKIMAWLLFGDMVENPLPAINLIVPHDVKAQIIFNH